MKFARYLEETQTPEWKKAYIDYRGLKKRIAAIRDAHQATAVSNSEEGLVRTASLNQESVGSPHSADSNASGSRPVRPRDPSGPVPTETSLGQVQGDGHDTIPKPPDDREQIRSGPARLEEDATMPTPPPLEPHASTAEPEVFFRVRPGRANTVTTAFGRAFQKANSNKGSALQIAQRFDLRQSIPLIELLPQLTPIERAFFEKLDQELDKVESFYCEREQDMKHRANVLKEQLQELKDHRQAFYDAHPAAIAPSFWLPVPLPSPIVPNLLLRRRKARQGTHARHSPPPNSTSVTSWRRSFNSKRSVELSPPMSNTTDGDGDVSRSTEQTRSIDADGPNELSKTKLNTGGPSERPRWRHSMSKNMQALIPLRHGAADGQPKKGSGTDGAGHRDGEGSGSSGPESPGKKNAEGVGRPRYDPEEYQHAKKQLKRAVLECYRGLEVLNNYRTLNLIGFRKALKKFEKVTRIPAQIAYTREKIEPSAFSSGATVDSLIYDLEALFAARFTRGDKKKAMARLRGGAKHTSHHFSTFRTGMALGLAVPALADGVYQSFREDTRAAIPGWDALLYIYGVFFVPTFFALIVGSNLLVWSRARINYVFIFELDIRTKMDHRVYFEMPAFLLSLLSYAFWLSFSRIGTENVAPTTWPLLWMGFVALVIFDPLPIMSKPSRWWMIRNVSRLLTSGAHRVEFADFWMGDQFCSLVYTLSNLYFVACVYATGIDPGWRRCQPHAGPQWGIAFFLASIPLLARLVQSVKRWVDSGLITHLINGGKYGSGILYYLFYYLWRAQGGARGPLFVVWCTFATSYSLYAGAWDLLMDWSLLRPHAPYPLLRPNLLYSNNVPFYYFAIVSNMLIRFVWVLYIPVKGPNFVVRTFIASMLEVLRRWQWNFLRLENEHLGNVDQYRVTREVPLPYSYDDGSHESDGDDDEDAKIQMHETGASGRWQKVRNGAVESSAPGAAREAEVGAVDD